MDHRYQSIRKSFQIQNEQNVCRIPYTSLRWYEPDQVKGLKTFGSYSQPAYSDTPSVIYLVIFELERLNLRFISSSRKKNTERFYTYYNIIFILRLQIF